MRRFIIGAAVMVGAITGTAVPADAQPSIYGTRCEVTTFASPLGSGRLMLVIDCPRVTVILRQDNNGRWYVYRIIRKADKR